MAPSCKKNVNAFIKTGRDVLYLKAQAKVSVSGCAINSYVKPFNN